MKALLSFFFFSVLITGAKASCHPEVALKKALSVIPKNAKNIYTDFGRKVYGKIEFKMSYDHGEDKVIAIVALDIDTCAVDNWRDNIVDPISLDLVESL